VTPELELLAAWEAAAAAAPPARGAALLHAADPRLSLDELLRLPVGRLDTRLVALRQAWFGDALTGMTTCAHCGARAELELRLSDFPREDDVPETFAVGELQCRLPDTRDLLAIASLDAESARRALAMRIAGAGTLSDETVDAIARALEKADPGGDVRIAASCPECDGGCEAVFDPSSFLWSEVNAAAVRLLRDVHALAAAYGWTEEEALTLPASRRRLYVAMVSS